MQNLHDDNYLDDLSRDAADNFEPGHDLHSWEKLHPHVEAALPQQKERKRRLIIFILLFLLVGGGLTFSTIWNSKRNPTTARNTNTNTTVNNTNTDKNSTKTKAKTETKNNTNTNTKASTDTKTNQPEAPLTKSPKAHITPAEKIPAGTELTQKAPPVIITKKRTQTPLRTTITDAQKKNTKNNDRSLTDILQNAVPAGVKKETNKPIADKPTDNAIANPTDSKTTDNKITDQPKTDLSKGDQSQPDKPAAEKTDTNKPAVKEQPTVAKPSAKKNKQIPALKNRWEFGLTYAPDVSTVKFTHTQKPGSNLGLTIGYNISRRFSLQTGILYTFKNYKSKGKDYHPPKDYWTTYYKIETVTARCNMWDIPLNLRYNLAPRKSSNLFISTGLSSYLMRQEDYNFFYYYNGTPTARYREMDTHGKDLFSVLNLSIAYERQLSKNISLEVEPFYKQPLKGIGFGNVKLNTTGLFLSVKYKPMKK